MGLRNAVVGSVLAALAAQPATAAQHGAAEPIPAPMRDLVWGKLNFLHTTDTHGWHAGHLQESQYSADWGDYVSFAAQMRKKADDAGVDLLLVDTGDRVEGNGLYDASSPKGQYYYDIYREQDVDIICTGNHELYIASTADGEHKHTVPNFKGKYIASNLDYIIPETGERIPMARRYRKFNTKNQGVEVVAFGFLFDFTGNANNTVVKPAREVIREKWFQEAIREKTDVFVVIGHVGVQMQEFKDIFTEIRRLNWLTPILFFGGHVHVRDATAYDSRSFAMASGRYFETIGWMSVDGPVKKIEQVSSEADAAAFKFHRRYIDNNLLGLYHHSGLNASTFHTEHGKNVTAIIAKARKELDLDYTFGCAPKNYWMSRSPYPGPDSIYTLLEEEVIPDIAVNHKRKDVPRLVIVNTGAIRFDIFKGAFTRDSTYITSPFLSVLNHIPDVPYHAAKKVIKLLNNAGKIMADAHMGNEFMAIPEQLSIKESIIYDAPANPFSGEGAQKPMGQHGHKEPSLIEGYTTRDDIGDDGDDAIHSRVNFYVVPNCIQTELAFPEAEDPETVDLVFFDFIQPWVLMALKFSGEVYTDKDVSLYVEGTFTELLAGWIKENWPAKC
ncbi:Metallo-dependent phosphatase-like protein [Triangularia verruculosa]|uniref:Metallo-dependent phosphatase-like protein n=1 Tax=Triangularia verruculosa TaxID=2587418 RepID=A0AAN6XJB4_9PEZI|nr:Metallo-dependent phosphatase-like protein [Triangularia verruculosa]